MAAPTQSPSDPAPQITPDAIFQLATPSRVLLGHGSGDFARDFRIVFLLGPVLLFLGWLLFGLR